MKMKLNFSHALALASALGLWAARAHAQYDVIVTPDQFQVQTFGSNISQDTVDAYHGDNSSGYYWTPNFTNSPSGTIVIPLPAGMQPGWHQYAICEWDPSVHSQQYNVVDIGADGGALYDDPPTEPWFGQYGTNQQWLKNPQTNQGGWVELGPGPQSDSNGDGGGSNPDLNGGYGVWMTPSAGKGNPYLQIHYLGFESGPESFDAFHVVQIDGPTWASDMDDPWSPSFFWSTGVTPNAPGAVANFLHAITAPRTVTVDLPVTVGLMNFSNTNGYTLASADGSSDNITMNNSGSNSLIEVLQGSHAIDAPMVLGGNGVLDLSLCTAGTFTIAGNISEAAAGTGVLKVDADSTGTLLLSGTNTYSSTEVLAGTLIVQDPYSLLDGSSLTVGNAAAFAGAVVVGGQAATPVPEPGTLALLAGGGAAVVLLVRRKRRA
jgi:hypothetical protein